MAANESPDGGPTSPRIKVDLNDLLALNIPWHEIVYHVRNARGHGSYGTVYAGVHPARPGQEAKHPQTELAVKLCSSPLNDIQSQKRFMREVEISLGLKHPVLLPLFSFSVLPVAVAMPRLPADLQKVLNEARAHPGTDLFDFDPYRIQWNATKRSIAVIGIAAGMEFLHDANVIHRDLKPSNVLIDQQSFPRIADFGFSKILSTGPEHVDRAVNMTIEVGTPLYMAPELWTDASGAYTQSVDIFAYAMIPHELCTGIGPAVTNFQRPYCCWGIKSRGGTVPRFRMARAHSSVI
jgi:serine/threonine protein kinase